MESFSKIYIFIKLFIINQLLILPLISALQIPPGTTSIKNSHTYMANIGILSPFINDCLYPKYSPQIPISYSMETLIDFIEKLEENLVNSTDQVFSKLVRPDDIATLLLLRFHLDDCDYTMKLSEPAKTRSDIDTVILGTTNTIPHDYYFPDYIYNQEELCSMWLMFSHFFQNTSDVNNRKKRDTYPFSNGRIPSQNMENEPQYPIVERGVVTFRNSEEAISPARVLIGIIAALRKSPKTKAGDILKELNNKDERKDLVDLKDPLLATTLANLPASASFYQGNQKMFDEKYIFGVKGEWSNSTCCNYYGIQQIDKINKLLFSSRGSLAQIRGSLDGYFIGKMLKKTNINQNIRLSNILRSYYSMPHFKTGNSDFSLSYCDRGTEELDLSALKNEIQAYSQIYQIKTESETFSLMDSKFNQILSEARSIKAEICQHQTSSNLDRNSPSDTPSDLIFVIDSKQDRFDEISKTIDEIIFKIKNIGHQAGTISIFVNSNSKNNVQLPIVIGGGSWPMPAMIFNSTNMGAISCVFRQDSSQITFSPQSNFGKFYKQLNQTIYSYKHSRRDLKHITGVPSKNVIIIDYGTLKVPSDSKDKSDYELYQEVLKWDNPDVRYLVMSSNQKDFKYILNKTEDYQSSSKNIGTQWANRISDNPATLIYEECREKISDGVNLEWFVSPGYKQNWAMYPEYFYGTNHMKFTIKAVDGSIRYCWDRSFPPQRNDQCKDLEIQNEELIEIHDPCYNRDRRNCDPVFFTIWGKEKKTLCADPSCMALNQVKFSISHEGIQCNSSAKIGAVFILQIVCLIFSRWAHFV